MKSLEPNTLAALAQIQGMSRRDFLKFSGVAAGFAAVAGMGLLGSTSAFAAVPSGIKCMGESEYGVFQRLLEVMLPVQGSALLPLDKVPVLQTLDTALLATMEPHVLQGLKGGIAYFEQGPVAAYGKPFTQLSDTDAASFLDAWADSRETPQRMLAVGLKKLVGLAYFANPPTWAALGYDGPVSDKWGLKPLGNAPMPKH
jgi:hypothetical protein